MKILSIAGCAYEDYEGQIIELHVELEAGEEVQVGDMISIEMMDGSFTEAEVKLISPKSAGDFAIISKKAAEFVPSKKLKKSAKGPCVTDIVVMDVPYHEVKTDDEIRARAMYEEQQKRVCLTPYKELRFGEKSIHDYVKKNYSVPDRVIAYLRTTQPYIMSPGIYEHPFKPGKSLLGPYTYTDGHYYWDRDTWKYVVKYHLTLPQEFVDYVMSEEGAAYIEQFIEKSDSWSETIKKWKKQKGCLCLLPDDAGEIELENF